MLLSNELLSKRNHCLTADTVKWVLKHAPSMEPDYLCRLKVVENAIHPLMAEESLYDDLPVEALGLFVMDSYFPSKHFNRAFAWLFGKESIEQINAASFSHYEELIKENRCYAIGERWRDLPFTDDEYRHVYGEFSKLFGQRDSEHLTSCQEGLMRHRCITPEIHQQIPSRFMVAAPLDVCTEIANECADKSIKRMKLERESPYCRKTCQDLLDDLKHVLGFKNLSRDRRDGLLAEFDIEIIGLTGIHKIYNGNIPDDLFNELLGSNFMTVRSVAMEPNVLADMRLPIELATQAALKHPIECAFNYFKRSDLDEDMRTNCLLALTDLQGSDHEISSFHAASALFQLAFEGVLTASEIALVHDQFEGDIGDTFFRWSDATGIEVPPAIQEKCIGDTFKTNLELKHFCDIPALVDAIRFLYTRKSMRSERGEQPKNLGTTGLSTALQNTRWTRETLLELLEITREEVVYQPHKSSQGIVRTNLFRKLFSESFYPSLDRDDLTGPYGRAENLLAHLLNGDAVLLGEDDIKQIINSRIQLDYKDRDVDLAKSLANHPELNERIIAERLRLQLEQISDTPSLEPARQRRAI